METTKSKPSICHFMRSLMAKGITRGKEVPYSPYQRLVGVSTTTGSANQVYRWTIARAGPLFLDE